MKADVKRPDLIPLKELALRKTNPVHGIFFDIDDTFSLHGKIPSAAYYSLWKLKNAGLKVVPITGRPAGWCDHIARMWPVDGVVGENGAFYFSYDDNTGRFIKRFVDDDSTRQKKRRKLQLIGDEILKSVDGTALASDQNYREADLAVDFCEDVPRLGWDSVEKICDVFRKHGATYKVSSIHVNGWFGNYSKLQMTCNIAQDLWNVDLNEDKDMYIYLGDSPNDEPLFEFFPLSIGVSNVLDFADRMEHLPAYVTEKEGGNGFSEAAELILKII